MKSLLIALALVASLGGCAYVAPYKIEVNQGNLVTEEMVSRLKEGMSKTQVRTVLGPPLIASEFHANRWDYHFTLTRRGQTVATHQLAVNFEGDQLKSWKAGELPKSLVVDENRTVDVSADNGPGMWQRLRDWWKK